MKALSTLESQLSGVELLVREADASGDRLVREQSLALMLGLEERVMGMEVERRLVKLAAKQFECYEAWVGGDYKLVCAVGANRSAKTYAGSVAYAEYLRDDAPAGSEHLCVTADQRLSRKNQQKLLWELLPHEMFDVEWSGPKNGFGTMNPTVVLDKPGKDNPGGRGVVVHFMTQTEYENNQDAFEGLTITTAWIDETVSHEVFSAVSARCSLSDDGRILVTAIPGAEWFHEVIFNASEGSMTWFKLFEWFDNPLMTKEKWERFCSRVPPHERDVRIRGVPALAGSMVFVEFDRRYRDDGGHVVRVDEVPDDLTLFAGHDVGMDHPTAVIFIGVDRDNRVWCVDEYVARNTTIEQDCECLGEILGERNLAAPAAIDPAAFTISKGNQMSPAMQYVRAGWPVMKALRTRDYGERAMIYAMKRMFHDGEIMVSEKCANLIRELCVWKYRRDQRNRPVTGGSPFEDRNNDCIDALRYILSLSPRYGTTAGVSVVSDD